MSEPASGDAVEDIAWASIVTPLSEAQLHDFCGDIQRLYRINPFLEFSDWRDLGNGKHTLSLRNSSQIPAFDLACDLSVEQQANGFLVTYSQGLKKSSLFKIESDAAGSKLTITESYNGVSPEEKTRRLGEVDKSLIKWAGDIQLFTVLWHRWSWLAPWRWYMRRIWQPVKPSSRRIIYMLLWISLAEAALVALGFVVYWIEFT